MTEHKTYYILKTQDKEEFLTCMKGGMYRSCLFEISQKVRSMYKHEEQPMPESWQDIRELIHGIIIDEGCEDALE